MRSTTICVPLYALRYMRATLMRANYTDSAQTKLLAFGLRSVYIPPTFRLRSARDPLTCCDRRILSDIPHTQTIKTICAPLHYAFHYTRSTICVPLLCVPITRARDEQTSVRSAYVPSTFRLRSAHDPLPCRDRRSISNILFVSKSKTVCVPFNYAFHHMRSTICVPL